MTNSYPKATQLKKKINTEWIGEQFEAIQRHQSSGRHVIMVGKYSCSEATKNELKRILIENGFDYKEGVNSYNVEKLVVTW